MAAGTKRACRSSVCDRMVLSMGVNLRDTYRASDEAARIATFALFSLIIVALVASIFFSPTFVLSIVGAVGVIMATFFRPTWVLGMLLLYLPFEPFLLKWIPDDIYVFARYGSEFLIYLLVAAVCWKLVSGSLQLRQTPVDIQFILFCVVLMASAVINLVPPVEALLGARQILRFVLLFFVTVYLQPSVLWMKTLFTGLIIVLSIQVFLGYGQFLIGEPLDQFLLPSEGRSFGDIQLTAGAVQFWDPGQRVFGTLGRYDRLGIFMALLLLVVVAMLYESKLKEHHKTLFILLIASLPVFALTYSRAGWFGFILGALFISVWAHRDRRVMVACGVAGAVMGGYLLFSGLVVNQLIDVPRQTVVERFFEAFSYERWRGEYYGLGRVFWFVQTVTTVVPASPIFGHGPAMYGGGAVAALGNADVYDKLGLPFGVYGTDGYIDNNWFSLWGEVGTLGFVIYLWLYLLLFMTCVRVWRRSELSQTRVLALGVAACMVSVGLNAMLGTYLEVRTVTPYLWVAAGLVVVLGEREEVLDI